jgi:DNA primase
MPNTPSPKEEIKRAADIVQVIGQYVQLKKAGKNFMGLCPFHAEKSPSFTVSPDKQMFHCFGCKKGGDVFDFWMAYHGVPFPEALKDLADRYNIPIKEAFSSGEEKERGRIRETLFKINEIAAQYFQEAMGQSGGNPAVEYLKKRALSKEIISEFRLGYAPDAWDGLTNFLKSRRIDSQMAAQAGLIIPKKGGGYYDRFRGRVMFPIFNLKGQVIGFGGRVLNDALPKYLNTPETLLFHKGEFPYGLHASYKAIRERGVTVIVEGYMDLLALRKHGFQEVVATLGTALTHDHIRKIKGYAEEAIVVFDSDEAGRVAALRSLPLFLNEGLSARAVVLPHGHDPDSFVNKNGLSPFLALLEKGAPLFEFFLDQKLTEGGNSIEGKVTVLKEILPILAQLQNRAQRSLYAGRLSERIGIKEDVILSELKAAAAGLSEGGLQKSLKERGAAFEAKQRIGDVQLLNLLVHHPVAVTGLVETDCWKLLSDATTSRIVERIFERYRQEGRFSPERLEESLENEEVRIRLREALVADSIYSDQEVKQAVREIEEKVRQTRLTNSIKAAGGDPKALNRVLLELKEREARSH